MSGFTSPLNLVETGREDSRGRPLYQLGRDLEYEIGFSGSGLIIRVPAGRLTNLATLPRSRVLRWLYWDIADIEGKYIAAPVLHDYLCNESFDTLTMTEGDGEWERVESGFSRFEAAAHFRTALRALGAPGWQSFTAYWAVRLNDVLIWLRS